MAEIEISGLGSEEICLLQNARNYHYYLLMIEQMKKGECPFCVLDPNLNRVLRQIGSARVWECPPAIRQKNIKRQFVLSPERHKADLGRMWSEEWDDFFTLARTFITEQSLADCVFAVRFGPPHLNARSIMHGHGNIFMPDGSGKTPKLPDEDLSSIPGKAINSSNGWWVIEYPAPPFPHTTQHFVIYSSRRFRTIQDIPDLDWRSLTELIAFMVEGELGYGLPGGGLIIRSGDPSLNGGLDYVRADIIVPDGTGRVEIPMATNAGITLAKDPADIAKKRRMIEVFEKMRLGNAFESLSAEEQALVKDRLG